jgi:hypothetical protein
MDEEKIKKLNYINENIIEKGYNPEDLSNFVIKKSGIPMEHLNFEQLEQMIEQFKDQSLQDTYQTVKIKEVGKKKEESPLDLLYSPQSYDVKTQPHQKNILLDFEEKKQLIKVTISEPKLERNGGFFSKALYSYRIVTSLLEKDVRRTYNDFEWFRDQLFYRYPLRIVPPLIRENQFNTLDLVDKNDTEKIIEEKKAKYLNNFINKLLQRKLYRTSPIVLEFLELEDKAFKKYRELLTKNKYELNIMLDNLKTFGEKIHCEIKKDDIKKADGLNKNYIKLSEIYLKLEKGISNIVNDFLLLENHMKEISNQFILLSSEFSENENSSKMKNIFSDLNKLFSQWSVSYGNQSKFFKDDFKFFFKYMNLETQELSHIYRNYTTFKSEYEDFTLRINKKKEELFEQKDFSKWSLQPGTESQLPMFQNNKKIAFEKMLYKETYLLSQEKKRIACTVHLLFRQYDKMLKHQSSDLEEYFKNLKEKNELVLGDAHSLIKLFSIIAEGKENENEKEKQNKKENEAEKENEKENEKEKEEGKEKNEEKDKEKEEEKDKEGQETEKK